MARNTSTERLRTAKRTNQVSAEGRAACAAAGAANLRRYLDSQETTPDARDELQQFQADLLRPLGPEPTAAERSLARSAATSNLVISLALAKLSTNRRWRPTEGFMDALSRQQGTLLRTLRALGVDLHGATAEPDGQALEDLVAEIATKRDGKGADDGKPTQR